MAKKINIVGAKPKRVNILDKPRRRVDPAEVAAALGAEPEGVYVGQELDPISLAEIGTQLLKRLRSTGGRPALADATELCRVPLSTEDMAALERITCKIQTKTGTKPSPGQVASVIVKQYLSGGAIQDQVSDVSAAVGEINRDEVQEQVGAIEAAAKEFKEVVESSLQKVVKMLKSNVGD